MVLVRIAVDFWKWWYWAWYGDSLVIVTAGGDGDGIVIPMAYCWMFHFDEDMRIFWGWWFQWHNIEDGDLWSPARGNKEGDIRIREYPHIYPDMSSIFWGWWIGVMWPPTKGNKEGNMRTWGYEDGDVVTCKRQQGGGWFHNWAPGWQHPPRLKALIIEVCQSLRYVYVLRNWKVRERESWTSHMSSLRSRGRRFWVKERESGT